MPTTKLSKYFKVTLKKKYKNKKTKPVTKKKKKYVTRKQVKNLINASQDPLYLKHAIGKFENKTYTCYGIVTTNNRKITPTIALMPGGANPARRQKNIGTYFQILPFTMPVASNAPNSDDSYGNSRTDEISLKRIACNIKVFHEPTRDILFKYAIIKLKGSNSGDFANFQTEVEASRVINMPGTYLTVRQNQLFQDRINYRGMFNIEKQKTLRLKASAVPSLTSTANSPAGEDPRRYTTISWSKKFGDSGKKVLFNEDNPDDSIGSLDQYILILCAVGTDNKPMIDGIASGKVVVCGTQTIYWTQHASISEPS